MSLIDELIASASTRRGLYCFDGSRYRQVPYAQMVADAKRAAGKLRGLGVEPGQAVGCVLTNCPAALSSVLGIWLTGCSVVSLPALARGVSLDTYATQLDTLAEKSGCDLLLLEQRYLSTLIESQALASRVVSYESIVSGTQASSLESLGLDDVAFIQFSSGSTSEPRGCMLTLRAISEQVRMLRESLMIDPDRDRGMIWLPLSHDMGLFGGFMAPWSCGAEVTMSSPERFLGSPSTWISDCARFDATITAAPSFALAMASRARSPAPDLGGAPLRATILGGERVDWASIEAATSALGTAGLTMGSIVPAYGLAESTLAVTMSALDQPPTYVSLHMGKLVEGDIIEVDRGHVEAALFV